MTVTPSEATNVDVVIIGAGISGLGAAYRITEHNPGTSYVILERREQIGGTWDLFRYPGVRSDSSIFTLCFPWEPWTRKEGVADGVHIREYLRPQRTRTASISTSGSHSRPLGGLELLGRHLDGHRRAGRGREDLPRPLPVLRVRLLQLRRGLHPGLPRHRRVRRHRRASAVLAARPRLHRQEDGGYRQRRHGDVVDPVAGREGRQGHHAAALADLRVPGVRSTVLPRIGYEKYCRARLLTRSSGSAMP